MGNASPIANHGAIAKIPNAGANGSLILRNKLDGKACRYIGVILIRFQDEPNGGRVSAWQDHAGLIRSLLSGRN
jgi:hypothetical protein